MGGGGGRRLVTISSSESSPVAQGAGTQPATPAKTKGIMTPDSSRAEAADTRFGKSRKNRHPTDRDRKLAGTAVEREERDSGTKVPLVRGLDPITHRRNRPCAAVAVHVTVTTVHVMWSIARPFPPSCCQADGVAGERCCGRCRRRRRRSRCRGCRGYVAGCDRASIQVSCPSRGEADGSSDSTSAQPSGWSSNWPKNARKKSRWRKAASCIDERRGRKRNERLEWVPGTVRSRTARSRTALPSLGPGSIQFARFGYVLEGERERERATCHKQSSPAPLAEPDLIE